MENLDGAKNLVFSCCYNSFILFKQITKEVFNVQGAWHSPSPLYMVHGHFPYYNLMTNIQKVPLSNTQECAEQGAVTSNQFY